MRRLRTGLAQRRADLRIAASVATSALLLLAGNQAVAQSAATSPAMSAVTAPDETVDAPPPEAPDMLSPPLAQESDATTPPVAPQAAALPAGSGALDSATVQRIVDRLVALHFLPGAADAQNPEAMVQAIKDFQSSAGISPSGTLDRDTIGRLTTP